MAIRLRQSCNVRVQGRRQRYRRALQTIQNEEYLSAVGNSSIFVSKLVVQAFEIAKNTIFRP